MHLVYKLVIFSFQKRVVLMKITSHLIYLLITAKLLLISIVKQLQEENSNFGSCRMCLSKLSVILWLYKQTIKQISLFFQGQNEEFLEFY